MSYKIRFGGKAGDGLPFINDPHSEETAGINCAEDGQIAWLSHGFQIVLQFSVLSSETPKLYYV
ncbi:MAG: hypothetical protein EOP06_15405 [Proteobacteria bacterium]|nr:MAG: hypothetical protein EOP06_15405 [Pseudomonadota bacterium]